MANKRDGTFEINFNSFGGFAPAYFTNTYSSIGQKGQANSMFETDLTDPSCIKNSRKVSAYSGNMVTVIFTSILKTPTLSNMCFAGGGNKVYRFSSTALENSPYPLTIKAPGSNDDESIQDMFYYKDYLFVTYTYSVTGVGSKSDIAMIDLSGPTVDPDWGSTVPTGAALLTASVPHYMVQGGDDKLYITNGKYIASLSKSGSTFTLETQDLDLWENSQAVSIAWNNDKLYIASNRPNISGSNYSQSSIVSWNGVSSSWDGDPIETAGKIGCMYVKNGIVYVFHENNTSSSLSYINGLSLQLITKFTGTAPTQNKVCEYDGYLAWIGSDIAGSNVVFLFGQADQSLPNKLFIYCYGANKGGSTIATSSAIAAPFNSLVVASKDASSPATYYLGGFIGTAAYSQASKYYTTVMSLLGSESLATIDTIKVVTEPLTANSKLDVYLYYNQNSSSLKLTPQISGTGKTVHTMNIKGVPFISDFRLMLDWSVTSQVTAPIKVRSIHIKGHYINSKDIR